jgi:poly(3-hydroxybutyrate) depolymerase
VHQRRSTRAVFMWRRAAFILMLCGLAGLVVLWSSSGSSGSPGGPGLRTGHTARTRPHVLHTSVSSRFLHARLPLTLLVPAGGGAGRPLLVFLHGRGGGPNSELSEQLFAALRSVGARAPDIAFPYGGVDSYWHNRASGDWGSYVLDEVIPQAIRMLHAEPRRVAIGGISMGGFGAYAIARMDPSRFCAVGGHSAAIFPSAALTAPGAFDDASDFARNDLIAFAAAHTHPYRERPAVARRRLAGSLPQDRRDIRRRAPRPDACLARSARRRLLERPLAKLHPLLCRRLGPLSLRTSQERRDAVSLRRAD